MRTHRLFSIVLCILSSLACFAQKIPVNPKFGAVSDAEIDLAVYEPDTSAAALMLYRECVVDFRLSNGGEILKETTVHERIKVLKEAGKSYGDYSFIYYSNSGTSERYSDIKVETFNRENGKVVRSKMSKNYVFDEKYSNTLRRRSFSAENVKVGSVIEVSYKFISPRYYDSEEISLQLGIPINKTHVEVKIAEFFSMNRTRRGDIPMQYRSESYTASLGTEGALANVNEEIYDAVDVPALRSEPYSFCPSQYRAAVIYTMSGIRHESLYRNFSMNWDAVDKTIRESDIFAACQSRFRDADELRAAAGAAGDDEAAIVAARNLVAGKVKWNGESDLVPAAGKEVLASGSGSDADINALTASALNTLGYVAEPVMIRRRSSGGLMDYQISANSFDTFLLRVTTKDKSKVWFLDAARDDGFLNVLNPEFLVNKARLVPFEGSGQWLDLTHLAQNRITVLASAEVSEDGVLSGKARISAQNESSYSVKSRYRSFDSEEAFLEDLEADENVEVSSFNIQKEYGPKVEMSYEFKKEHDSGERLYIRPVLSLYHPEAAFQKEERKIPVDFPYPESLNYTFVLNIPEGYVVEELPESKSLSCPPVEGRIVFQMRQAGNNVSAVYRFVMGKSFVPAEDYADLRLFWETAAGIEKSTIVLRKK